MIIYIIIVIIILFCICIFCCTFGNANKNLKENMDSSFKVDHYKYPIKLIYDDNAAWEIDYVITEICNIKPFTVEPILIKTDELLNTDLTTKYENIINNNILVFNHISSYESIEKVIKNIKPIIIIYLTDEYGNQGKYLELSKYVKLFLRPYTFKHYNMQNYNNVIQIPLGYMNGMFNKKYALDIYKKPIEDREYIWSFIGNIKADRQKMVDKFKSVFKEKYFLGNNMKPDEMAKIYQNTVFIPNGRGNNVLDCFRLYEAVFCGAIPISVGDSKEINETFDYNGNKPPFIYANTWDEAVKTCEQLLENKSKLRKLQEDNFNWLKNMIDSIHDKMREAIEK
jgi:hypothetical protein